MRSYGKKLWLHGKKQCNQLAEQPYSMEQSLAELEVGNGKWTSLLNTGRHYHAATEGVHAAMQTP